MMREHRTKRRTSSPPFYLQDEMRGKGIFPYFISIIFPLTLCRAVCKWYT